jgi:hypothetical protein
VTNFVVDWHFCIYSVFLITVLNNMQLKCAILIVQGIIAYDSFHIFIYVTFFKYIYCVVTVALR